MKHDLAIVAAVEAAANLGLPGAGAVVAREAETVQVRLPDARAVARVHAPAGMPAALREVAVARVLAAAGVPAARLIPGAQPVSTTAGPVTVWEWLDATGATADLGVVAGIASILHEATGGADLPASAPPSDPFAAIGSMLDTAAEVGGTADPDLDMLHGVAARSAGRWSDLAGDDPLGHAVVHGDLHRKNIVMTAAGAVLVDLEVAGVGPRCYDLAAIAVAGRRYGVPEAEVDRALRIYGADPRRWSGFDELCQVYELWVTAWSLSQRTTSRAADVEAHRRLERWRTGSSAPWTLAWLRIRGCFLPSREGRVCGDRRADEE